MSSKGIATCVFDETLGKFRVTKSKGKSLCCGGYGVPHTVRVDETASSVTHDYLFVEEVLFLHERGLLEVYKEDDLLDCKNPDEQEQQHETTNVQDKEENDLGLTRPTCHAGNHLMTTRDLYHVMLHKLNMPLAVYLTYSHLRSQTFIVLRHTSKRIDIIRRIGQYMQSGNDRKPIKRKRLDQQDNGQDESYQQEDEEGNNLLLESKTEYESSDSSKNHDKTCLTILKKELRDDSFLAPSPQLMTTCHNTYHGGDLSEQPNDCITPQKNINDVIAFDVYKPNSNFKKTMPGMPDFLVSIVPFSEPTDFFLLQSIVGHCGTIPLKIATVSESGTVSMFGISDLGVPLISSSME
jgi:hypothetical protein